MLYLLFLFCWWDNGSLSFFSAILFCYFYRKEGKQRCCEPQCWPRRRLVQTSCFLNSRPRFRTLLTKNREKKSYAIVLLPLSSGIIHSSNVPLNIKVSKENKTKKTTSHVKDPLPSPSILWSVKLQSKVTKIYPDIRICRSLYLSLYDCYIWLSLYFAASFRSWFPRHPPDKKCVTQSCESRLRRMIHLYTTQTWQSVLKSREQGCRLYCIIRTYSLYIYI